MDPVVAPSGVLPPQGSRLHAPRGREPGTTSHGGLQMSGEPEIFQQKLSGYQFKESNVRTESRRPRVLCVDPAPGEYSRLMIKAQAPDLTDKEVAECKALGPWATSLGKTQKQHHSSN